MLYKILSFSLLFSSWIGITFTEIVNQCDKNKKSEVSIEQPDIFEDFDIEEELKKFEAKLEREKKTKPQQQKNNSPPIRFIRIAHGTQGWDDGMGHTKADKNFLAEFQKVLPQAKVRQYSESHPINHLDLYPDDGFPPFIFMTGQTEIKGVSKTNIATLRKYCLRGGMIFADSGSPAFHKSFINLMKLVFPKESLSVIPDDDTIYKEPYSFKKGAPKFWASSGLKPMGIKNSKRWCVFYHPGDMNDAWKSKGFTMASYEMRKSSYNLGMNVIFYSFHTWIKATSTLKTKK
jgi:hypothetical protein